MLIFHDAACSGVKLIAEAKVKLFLRFSFLFPAPIYDVTKRLIFNVSISVIHTRIIKMQQSIYSRSLREGNGCIVINLFQGFVKNTLNIEKR